MMEGWMMEGWMVEWMDGRNRWMDGMSEINRMVK